MTTEAKSNLKKKYKIVWFKEAGFGREAPAIFGHYIIETPAQHVFNQLIDMLTYKSPYSK